MKIWAANVSKVKSAALRHSLQTVDDAPEIIASFNNAISRFMLLETQCDPKFICRLWIERLTVAFNDSVEMTKNSEMLKTFSPARDSCVKLQQYCAAYYPDYVEDMLSDVKSIEHLHQKSELDMSELATSTRFLLDQLREDCNGYSAKQAADDSIPRSEERWEQLALICERLMMWLKQVPPGHEQFPAEYLTQTIQFLGAFEAQFPKRVPADLPKSMRSLMQKFQTCSTATDDEVYNTVSCETGGGADHYTNKKRLHADTNSIEPELRVSSDVLKLVITKYVEAASTAKLLILDVTGATASAKKALTDLKTAATAANAAICDLLEHDENICEELAARFSCATEFMAKTISSGTVDDIEYTWLDKTTKDLLRILQLGSGTALVKEPNSFPTSFAMVEVYLENNFYVWEGENVSTLDAMEIRVRRFQGWLNNKKAMGPVHSIAGSLLADIERFITVYADCHLWRSPKNWERFTAVGNVFSDWIDRALQANMRPSWFFNNLLDQLLEFEKALIAL